MRLLNLTEIARGLLNNFVTLSSVGMTRGPVQGPVSKGTFQGSADALRGAGKRARERLGVESGWHGQRVCTSEASARNMAGAVGS